MVLNDFPTVLPGSYSYYGFKDSEDGPLEAWLSTGNDAKPWDGFLSQAAGGKFEQTGLWAQVKSMDGWSPVRVVVCRENAIVGGFQVLMRKKAYAGVIGYISMGPVYSQADEACLNFLVELLKRAVRDFSMRALIVYAPAEANTICPLLRNAHFLPNRVISLAAGCYKIDLTVDLKAVRRNMRKDKQKNIRKGKTLGVSVREGSSSELNIFYDLMLKTCERQAQAPNPARFEVLMTMWRLFSPRGYMKLFFAESDGSILSGNLVITFGNSAYLWKFGWSGQLGKLKPNDVLYWEIITWARNNGYQSLYILGADTAAAELAAAGESLPAHMHNNANYFKMGFGGRPVRFPDSLIYLPNRFFRAIYRSLCLNAKVLTLCRGLILKAAGL